MAEEIINRQLRSPLVTLDLSTYQIGGARVVYDLTQNLFEGLALKEQDFRQFLAEHDWQSYKGKHVAIGCSAEAIIPLWAEMLLATYLANHAQTVVYGSLEELEKEIIRKMIAALPTDLFANRAVVVKGCTDIPFPAYTYVQLTQKLLPVVKRLMFGEACSMVPIYKRANR